MNLSNDNEYDIFWSDILFSYSILSSKLFNIVNEITSSSTKLLGVNLSLGGSLKDLEYAVDIVLIVGDIDKHVKFYRSTSMPELVIRNKLVKLFDHLTYLRSLINPGALVCDEILVKIS